MGAGGTARRPGRAGGAAAGPGLGHQHVQYLSRTPCGKGVVTCEKRGRSNWYAPAVSREAYLEFESGAVLSRVFGSSLKNFVASLARGAKLERGELDELQQYLDELKRDGL